MPIVYHSLPSYPQGCWPSHGASTVRYLVLAFAGLSPGGRNTSAEKRKSRNGHQAKELRWIRLLLPPARHEFTSPKFGAVHSTIANEQYKLKQHTNGTECVEIESSFDRRNERGDFKRCISVTLAKRKMYRASSPRRKETVYRRHRIGFASVDITFSRKLEQWWNSTRHWTHRRSLCGRDRTRKMLLVLDGYRPEHIKAQEQFELSVRSHAKTNKKKRAVSVSTEGDNGSYVRFLPLCRTPVYARTLWAASLYILFTIFSNSKSSREFSRLVSLRVCVHCCCETDRQSTAGDGVASFMLPNLTSARN